VNGILKAGVDCYMSAECADELGVEGHHRVSHIWADDMISFGVNHGAWVFKSFEAAHDVFCLGFLISIDNYRILYLSDSAYSKYTFPGITHMMIGVNYDSDLLKESNIDQDQKRRIMQSHASLKTICDFLKVNDLSKLQEVYLLHLSERNADPEKIKREIKEIVGVPVYIKEEGK